ncbi:MAG: hypothetical protein PHE77_01335 [Candidatus Pacebacteria bacterium]|nr:hypothetical protein [Candidatus Paceibacterota bacterium]
MSCYKIDKDGNFVDAFNESAIIAENDYRPVNRGLSREVQKMQEEEKREIEDFISWLIERDNKWRVKRRSMLCVR